ncbi:DUF4932 domain-containing protein [Runella sp.]|uniref:DUF4932 domain-containing protein n=1 Tax=Runella sp. TaxID=1960881 RepID=UPI003D137102
MKTLLSFLFSFFVLSAIAQTELTVGVHSGMELFAVIHCMAGKTNTTPSQYATDVKTYFKPYENHPAVVAARNRSWYYYDIHELGFALGKLPDNPVIQHVPAVWERVMKSRDSVRIFMEQALDFYRKSNFQQFYDTHRDQYAAWGQPIREAIQKDQIIEKLEAFYGKRKSVKWYIALDVLNANGAHAVIPKMVNPALEGMIIYQQGYWSATKPDEYPRYKITNFLKYDLTWHEGSHVLTNDLQKQYKKEIEELSPLWERLDDDVKESLQRQVKEWPHCFDETLVRAISTALQHQNLSPDKYERALCKEIAQGFVYVKDVEEMLINEYLPNRQKYADFEAFFPQILANLKKRYLAEK